MNIPHPTHARAVRRARLATCTWIVSLLTLTLPGCGGNPTPPAAAVSVIGGTSPAIQVTASLSTVKRLTLTWSSPELALAQTARVLEDPDGDGPLPARQLTEVPAADATATIEVFLPTAWRASYHVSLCNGSQCVDSAPLGLGDALERYAGRLKSTTPQVNQSFGETVALSRDGRVLAVGVEFGGPVQLFEHTAPGQWLPRGQVAAPYTDAGDRFGRALALSGDGEVLVVGDPFEDALGSADGGLNNLAPDAGAAYVYRRVGDTWVFNAYLKGSEAAEGACFGAALDISDDGLRIAIGAPGGANLNGSVEGAAYEFVYDQGSWTQTLLLRDGNRTADDFFGRSVALNADGSVLAVGSHRNPSSGFGVFLAPIDDAGAPASGAVYIYRRSGIVWSLEAFIKPPYDLDTGELGQRVDLEASGNLLVASAPLSGLDPQNQLSQPLGNPYSNSGSLHVWTRTNGAWAHEAVLRQPNPRSDDRLASTALQISADGRTIIAGSYLQDTQGSGLGVNESVTNSNDFGTAYVFYRQSSGWSAATVLKPSDRTTDTTAQGGLWFGRSVAISGDGRTVAIGASSHDGPGQGMSVDPAVGYAFDLGWSNTGAVFVY
jgi:trimeric autotransporter adhesin